jgi:DNA-binding LacI/PurR family transcriptional regulator
VCQANATGLGEAFAEELLRGDDPPDAIAAMSDELALGALRAAARTGRAVPAPWPSPAGTTPTPPRPRD